jgi:hypothetical protein
MEAKNGGGGAGRRWRRGRKRTNAGREDGIGFHSKYMNPSRPTVGD